MFSAVGKLWLFVTVREQPGKGYRPEQTVLELDVESSHSIVVCLRIIKVGHPPGSPFCGPAVNEVGGTNKWTTPNSRRLISDTLFISSVRFQILTFFFIKSLRQKAVQLLQLKPGNRVLAVGCGPGGSFPYLVDAVGPSGEVIGVEISPEVVINARRRIERIDGGMSW
jgi:hypothetical protein